MPLVVDPSSTCDICLEPFNLQERDCLCTPCGHLFCRSCLNRLVRPQCPLCREDFNNEYLLYNPFRKLHLDHSNNNNTPERPSEQDNDPDVHRKARKLAHRLATQIYRNNGRFESRRIAELREEISNFFAQNAYLDSTLSGIDTLLGEIEHVHRRRERDINGLTSRIQRYEARIDHLERAQSRGQVRQCSPVVFEDPPIIPPKPSHFLQQAREPYTRPRSPPVYIEVSDSRRWVVHGPPYNSSRSSGRY